MSGMHMQCFHYRYFSLCAHAHSRGLRKTSMSFPSSVPSAPMSDMYSHLAVSGKLLDQNRTLLAISRNVPHQDALYSGARCGQTEFCPPIVDEIELHIPPPT